MFIKDKKFVNTRLIKRAQERIKLKAFEAVSKQHSFIHTKFLFWFPYLVFKNLKHVYIM